LKLGIYQVAAFIQSKIIGITVTVLIVRVNLDMKFSFKPILYLKIKPTLFDIKYKSFLSLNNCKYYSNQLQ
jgi:hypothetical protein